VDIPTCFTTIIMLFDEAFKYGDGAKFVVVLGQML
jgi:hypothetical protein